MSAPLWVLCVKWGARYGPGAVNMLYRAVADHCDRPLRFVCLTEDPRGLIPQVMARPLPRFALERADWAPGMWPKLGAFAPGLVPDGAPALLLDLDVMIWGPLAPLVAQIEARPGLHIIRDWPDTHQRWIPALDRRRSNSSVVGFVGGAQTELFTRFAPCRAGDLSAWANDQDYLHALARDRHHWPAPWVLSFKRALAWHLPLNLLLPVPAPPADCAVLAFHGRPDMPELDQSPGRLWGQLGHKFGLRPVPWVQAYLRRYGGAEMLANRAAPGKTGPQGGDHP